MSFRSTRPYRSQPSTARARQARVFRHLTGHSQRSGICLSRECRLSAGGHSSYVTPRSCTERERPSAGAVPFRSAGVRCSQPGRARARQLTFFADSLDSVSAVALACRSRKSRLCVGGHSSHVAPRSFTERERPLVDAVPFHSAAGDRGQRDTALARDEFACFPTSRETACAVALTRRSRECRLRDGGQSTHVAPRSCMERERTPVGAVFFHRA